jgi:pimeloyl-ACP methyl ester carboxylesterase
MKPKIQRRPRPHLFALALVSVALLYAPSAAQSAPSGTVVAWGCAFGPAPCTVPTGLAGVTAVAAGTDHSLALKSDGTVTAWGCRNLGVSEHCQVPEGLTDATAIAAGHTHSLALREGGTVVAWGCAFADFGQCSVPEGLSGVKAIAANANHSMALKSDGTVVAWRCFSSPGGAGACVPQGLTGVIAIAAGHYHSLALLSDGTVFAWGCSSGFDFGQCSVPNGLSGVVAIAAGFHHSLALLSDGRVVAWGCGVGSSDTGQCTVPNGLSGVTAISTHNFHNLALKSDGTVVGWGCPFPEFGCAVPGDLTGVGAISAGASHSLAAKTAPSPIIFLHAFLGSKINCFAEELWPRLPPSLLEWEGEYPRLLDMRLDALGIQNHDEGHCNPFAAPSGALVERVMGGDVYAGTKEFLNTLAPGRAYFYPWDWRKSPEQALAGLDFFIDGVRADHGGAKVVLVGHSMGGLVTRWYIDHPSRALKVDRALTLGTPYWGAPKALFPLAAGEETPVLSTLDPFLEPNDHVKQFARNLQGLYFLYPSRVFGRWLSVAGRVPKPLDELGLLDYVSTELGGNANLLRHALEAHSSNLDGFKTNGVDYQVVVGTGMLTISSVRITPSLFLADHVQVGYDSGDKTVPARSAAQGDAGTADPLGENIPIHYVCEIEHMALAGDPAVHDRIKDFLLTGAPVTGTDENCEPSGMRVDFFKVDIGLVDDGERASVRRTASADPPLALAEAEFQGLIELIEWGDRVIVVANAFAPVTLTVSGEELAFHATPLVGDSEGTPTYFGPLDGTLTLEVGSSLVVTKDGAPVDPGPADTSPPVTKAKIVVGASALELSPVASDDSGVAATFIQVGSDPPQEWTSPLELPLDADLSTVRFASVDVFGNVESEHAVPGNSTDATPPSTSASAAPGANAAGWNTADVTVYFGASDETGGSGVREIAYRLAGAETGGGVLPGAGGSLTIRSQGITTLTFSARDRGGNAEPERTFTIRIDRTGPGIAIRSPSARRYTRGARVTANYGCTDGISGVAACTGPVLSGAQIDTRRVGVRRFTVNATDRAGNTAARSISYTVVPRVVRCVVPNVRGKRLAAARRAIIRASCSVGRVRRVRSARVRPGRVVSQTPKPGRRLRKGAKVHLVLSR